MAELEVKVGSRLIVKKVGEVNQHLLTQGEGEFGSGFGEGFDNQNLDDYKAADFYWPDFQTGETAASGTVIPIFFHHYRTLRSA